MGLKIVDGEVIVDHAEPAHLNTGISGNPTELTLHGIAVHCVFQRKRNSAKASRDRDKKVLGDNCPLIYALKGMDGLTVSWSSIKVLNLSIPTIVDAIAEKLVGEVDVVVPMPSSSGLASILARRLARRATVPLRDDLLVKSTNLQASNRAKALTATGNKSVPRTHVTKLKPAIRKLIRSHTSPYSAKDVRTDLRQYFDPLQCNAHAPALPVGTRLLLVDDLMATGETLLAARDLLLGEGHAIAENAVTWFGPIREPS